MKSNADAFNNCAEHIVTERGRLLSFCLVLKLNQGVIKSEKNTKNEDVMIGRQQATAEVEKKTIFPLFIVFFFLFRKLGQMILYFHQLIEQSAEFTAKLFIKTVHFPFF